MEEHQARLTEETMRRLGIPGVAAPVEEPTGEWAIYDRSAAPRRDITARARAVVRARLGARQGLPWSDVPPARGFVFPRLGRRP